MILSECKPIEAKGMIDIESLLQLDTNDSQPLKDLIGE